MKYKYIFFDWGYTLISKFENVDDKINKILEKYNLQWDDIFRKWKSYQILNSLIKVYPQSKNMYLHSITIFLLHLLYSAFPL